MTTLFPQVVQFTGPLVRAIFRLCITFLWDYVKSVVYADKAATLKALEGNIQATIDAILPDLLEK